ncbi:MAG: hypothetical protein GYB41_15140 [Oceanospirillales bacterium]|nr:hypothetical protein [Oceanospirillales bacterium]
MLQRLPLQLTACVLLILTKIGNVDAKDVCTIEHIDQASMNQCAQSDNKTIESKLNLLVIEIIKNMKKMIDS